MGLWLHSSGNGLHKKEVNPHVGTRPGPWHVDAAELKKTREEGRALTLPPRTPSGPDVGIHNNCVRL